MIGQRLRRWLAGKAAELHPELDKVPLDQLLALLRARSDALSTAAADRLERASRVILEQSKRELDLRLQRLGAQATTANGGATPEGLQEAVAEARRRLEELRQTHAPAAAASNVRTMRPKGRR